MLQHLVEVAHVDIGPADRAIVEMIGLVFGYAIRIEAGLDHSSTSYSKATPSGSFLSIPLVRPMLVSERAKASAFRPSCHLPSGPACCWSAWRWGYVPRFERTPAFEQGIKAALKARKFPAQIIWSRDDPALKMKKFANHLLKALDLESYEAVYGKHFLQEDSSPAIASSIARLISALGSSGG
jgi:hypothetical protein